MILYLLINHGCVPGTSYNNTCTYSERPERNRNDVDDYRGIALSSIPSTLVENVVIAKCNQYWWTEIDCLDSRKVWGIIRVLLCNTCSFCSERNFIFLENGHDDVFWLPSELSIV